MVILLELVSLESIGFAYDQLVNIFLEYLQPVVAIKA